MAYTGIITQNMSVFRISLFQSWHVSRLSATKISTWYLILQKCIFTNTRVSFDRKATGLVTMHVFSPNTSVLPPASFASPTCLSERQQRPSSLELGLSGQNDSSLPRGIGSLSLIHMLPVRQTCPFVTPEERTHIFAYAPLLASLRKSGLLEGFAWKKIMFINNG